MTSIHSLTTLIVLGIFGSAIAIFLYSRHAQKKKLICPIGDPGECDAVVESKWGKTLGIKNELIGLGYFIIITINALLVWQEITKFVKYIQIFSLISILFSTYLLFIQHKVLKKYCFYCIMSTIVNILIFINIWFI